MLIVRRCSTSYETGKYVVIGKKVERRFHL